MMPPRIRCALCDRPVSEVEQWRNDASMTVRLRVFCHGDSDAMELPLHALADPDFADQLRNQEGVAFATARLDPPAGRSPGIIRRADND
ncbi:hypothetical protein SAMN04515666_101328 [Bosea lupini]|uniref:Uncharacterized protein n=1 Tax=Bosea lupini TaxID=1036779 RepID=A0A1H7GDX4_9HYPH|nr:hypothetical protein [Bosea lupini]SEK36328.1 hypothetical protein SAMN04515666_101328 [Bosea lupini]